MKRTRIQFDPEYGLVGALVQKHTGGKSKTLIQTLIILLLVWPGVLYLIYILPILFWPEALRWVGLDSIANYVSLNLLSGGYEKLLSISNHDFTLHFLRFHVATLLFIVFVYATTLIGFVTLSAIGYLQSDELCDSLSSIMPSGMFVLGTTALLLLTLSWQIFLPYFMDDDGFNSANYIGLAVAVTVSAGNTIVQYMMTVLLYMFVVTRKIA